MQILTAVLFLALSISLTTHAKGDKNSRPCKDKVEAQHQERKALRDCLDAWAKNSKPNDTEPTDNCSSKLSVFIQAAKDVKACRVEQQSLKQQKQNAPAKDN